MKNVKKLLLCFGVGVITFGVSTTKTYAYENIGFREEIPIPANAEDKIKATFDYTKYSEETLLKYLNLLFEKSELNTDYEFNYNCLKIEVNLALANNKFGDIKMEPAYLLRDRVQFEIANNKSQNTDYESILKDINKDIFKYEEELKEKEFQRIEKEKNEFRKKQETWANNFTKLFTSGFDWSKKDFKVESINIYDFFEDGKYTSPIRNQSLSSITENYSVKHPGIDIKLNENDEILSVANKGVATITDNKISINYGDVIINYVNILPLIKDGSIVNMGDVIGTYKNNDSSHKGVHIELIKDDKEYPLNWMLTELSFITNEGMSMPLYLQGDDLWKDKAYGITSIGPAGCGPSALSMAISYLNNEIITPAEVVEKVGGGNSKYLCPGQGSYWTLIDECPSMYGLSSKRIGTNRVIDALKEGHPVIAIMGPGQFTNGGHFITLSGIDEDGTIFVNDSNDDIYKQHYNKTFTLESIASECSCFWEISD